MNWPWRNAQSQPQSAATPEQATPLDALIARADTLRDDRRWADAATAYRTALQRAPTLAPIWVQLGHALKESGDFPNAEAAYRQALAHQPDTADTHLQLGHVLKLQGRRPAAIAAYATALKVDRSCTPAITELIALGEGWQAEQASALGPHMLAGLLQSAADLRAALSRLERALPDAASLVSVPPALFQSRYRLPPPPPAPAQTWGAIVQDMHTPDALIALLRSLAEQQPGFAAVTVISANPNTPDALRRYDNAGLACPVRIVPPAEPPETAGCDWLLLCESGSVLLPGARPWLDWAAHRTPAAAFYLDEDAATPILKTADDQEGDTPLFRHTVLALRPGPDWAPFAAGPLQAIADAAAARGGIAHLARILARRQTDPAPLPVRPNPSADPADRLRIGVIVPTRNGGAMLRDCIDALRATAAEPSRLDIVILDNGSGDPATMALLAEWQSLGVAAVIRDDAPFNWSRLNNAGAAACQSPLLLFVNDDVALTAAGWDQTVRRHLARPEIGAVGARLDYPDGSLQHGGIVFGPGGRAEHEGVAPIGISPDIAARWVTRRRVAAVTGAFLACRRTDFAALGGFDAAYLPIWFNDIDFCLKIRESGLAILYEPAIRATHHESRTLSAAPHDAIRQAIWDDSLNTMHRRWDLALQTDPGFNPHFARTGRPFELMMEPSTAAIEAHLLRSASPNPWRISRPDR